MTDKLKKLYQTVILVHDREPFQFRKREDAGFVIDAYNPVCGDRFQLYFDVVNGVIRNPAFHGFGCAISKASTSVLVKKLENKPLNRVHDLLNSFLDTVTPGSAPKASDDEEVMAFSAARDFPGRLSCATLAWNELKVFLEKSEEQPGS